MERRRRFTAEEKQSAVEAFKASGLSKNAFAKRIGVTWLTLHHWTQRSAGEEPSKLVPVRVEGSKSVDEAWAEFISPGGLRLRVAPGIGADSLRVLLGALRSC